ncbi:MFS transporter [Escherichia coli]
MSSLFCALSDSLQMLTLARVIQGFGGAALMSVNTALIRLIYPQRFLGRGMGINSFIVAVSSAAGPTIAAAILSIASSKWLFFNQRTVRYYRPASGDAFSATQWFSRQ